MACNTLDRIFIELKNIQEEFGKLTNEYNIYSNSKIYEIIIANLFGHNIVAGTHGADAQYSGKYYEYKHYKESSSNHTWTFNDYTDETIMKLESNTVLFVHINDVAFSNPFNYIDWYYEVSGDVIAKYISKWSNNSDNKRKMINISASQLETECSATRIYVNSDSSKGCYSNFIYKIFLCITNLEKMTKTTNLLTSNKLWELFLSNILGHKINSKQGGIGGKHDAEDNKGQKFEYKISQVSSWIFEDVSDNVIENMRLLDGIYVAKIDKRYFAVNEVLLLDTKNTMDFIKEKRDKMIADKQKNNKAIRRLSVSVSLNEAKLAGLIKNI